MWPCVMQMDMDDPKVLAAAGLVAVLLLLVVVSMLSGGSKAKFLNKKRQTITLGERINLSHDTVRFRFVLPKATPVLGLPVGKHFKLYCPNPAGKVAGQWNGREDPESDETEIERKYTPTTSDAEVGYVDLVIKVYKGGVIDRFPDGGKMSQYMDTLKVCRAPRLLGRPSCRVRALRCRARLVAVACRAAARGHSPPRRAARSGRRRWAIRSTSWARSA